MAKRNLGVGTLLIAVYGIFAVSATARASYQIIREFEQAPIAYVLSALAAGVYILATVSLARSGPRWRRISYLTIIFELCGVLIVGGLSVIFSDLFAHPSVWSGFGSGYGFIPLVLPVLGLFWLAKRNA